MFHAHVTPGFLSTNQPLTGHQDVERLPSGNDEQFANLNMAIEIVSFPIKNGDFPVRYVTVYQRVN